MPSLQTPDLLTLERCLACEYAEQLSVQQLHQMRAIGLDAGPPGRVAPARPPYGLPAAVYGRGYRLASDG